MKSTPSLAKSSLSSLLHPFCLWLLFWVHLQVRLKADTVFYLEGQTVVPCPTLPHSSPCSSPPSLHTDTASASLFCLPVSALVVCHRPALPPVSSNLGGGSEGKTCSPYWSPFANKAAELTTRTLLDHEEEVRGGDCGCGDGCRE